ncbi:hypothetical protein ACA910_008134 [Epithemia clementina (nom. ined.)]
MTTAIASFHHDDDHVVSAVAPALRMNRVQLLRWISLLILLLLSTEVTARQLNPQPGDTGMQPGDVCGVPGEDCIAAKCACRPCPDGVNFYGCCNDCVLDDELQCQHVSSCPPQPGQVCGQSGIDCPGLKCLCGTCEDGVNVYGCCSDCVYAFVNDKLECQSISTCP